MKKVAFKKQIQFKIIVNGGTIHNMYVLKCLNEVGVYLFFSVFAERMQFVFI